MLTFQGKTPLIFSCAFLDNFVLTKHVDKTTREGNAGAIKPQCYIFNSKTKDGGAETASTSDHQEGKVTPREQLVPQT